MDRYDFMREALTLAKEAAKNDEVPVGCVIVKDSQIIARSNNRTKRDCSPTKHAEILAIEEAGKVLESDNLTGCDIYVTLEPCPMCAGAIINAKINKVVFGAFDLNYGACGSVINLFSLPNTHTPECYGGIMEDDCSIVLKEFFENIRKQKRE
ncbi:MAG: nucleoside deaminase [Ruminococcaceae bacterium]|nr:nucleoside deaminase [Oscillospiraceae bacterium]